MGIPRVSIITGYYNRAPVLRRTVESILRQTFTDFELLVFDDGSTDGTAEQLAAMAEEYADPRFRYISHENKTFTRALVDAIAQTNGEYIAIQGAGDISRPSRIERQVQLLDDRADVVAVGCWYENVHESTGIREVHRPDAAKATGGMTTFSHGEMMVRRSSHDAVGGYRAEFKYGQLTDLGFRLSQMGTFATVPEILYERHLQVDGVTFNPSRIAVQSQYFELARQLHRLGADDAEALLDVVRARGIDGVVPVSSDQVQRGLRHKVVTLALGQDSGASLKLAGQVAPASVRFCYTTLARAAAVPFVGRAIRAGLSSHRRLKRFRKLHRPH